MVNGEVIMTPGCWTGYTPHNHPQPEVYTYKVDRPQGFGCAFIGDNVFKIEDNTWSRSRRPDASAAGSSWPFVTAG